MRRVMSLVLAMLMLLAMGISASAEVRVTEYLRDMSDSGISTYDTSVPTKKHNWSDGVYVGCLIDVKRWTFTQCTFAPNSSGAIHIMLQCGAGSPNETFTVTIYDASTGKSGKSISFTSDDNGAVHGEKGVFSGLDKGKRYYLKFQHGSGSPCLSGSFLFVNDSSTFDI